MNFAEVALAEAEGAILAHAVRLEGALLRKGRILSASDVRALLLAGYRAVTVARLEVDDVDEDAAAARVAAACAGSGVRVAAAFTGRVNLHANISGLAIIDSGQIAALNDIDESITIATLAPFTRVVPEQMLATVKIIPFAVPRAAVESVERLLGNGRVIRVAPFAAKPVALISTSFPDMPTKLLDKNRSALDARLAALGSTIVSEERISHRPEAVAASLRRALAIKADPILIFGAGAITDRRDVVPAGIEAAGGTVIHFGMPVDPGNLLLLGRCDGATVIGLPGCARSPKRNGFDMVLERVLAGIPVSRAEIAAMGVGGLLTEIASRPQPRDRPPAETTHAPQIAAIILAAGLSSRMGRNKLLCEIDGQPLLRRVANAVASSEASSIIAVTGNDADDARAALAGIPVTIAHNPDFRDGLSTSIRAGLRALPQGCDGVLIVLGDMPAIAPVLINQMIAAFEPENGRAICIAAFNGKRGNPVLFDRRFFPELLALSGDVGAKHIVAENDELVCEVEAGNEAPLIDIDTPEALAAWMERTR